MKFPLENYCHSISQQYRKVLIILYGLAIVMSWQLALNAWLTTSIILGLSVLGVYQWRQGVPTSVTIGEIEQVAIILDTGLFLLLRLYGQERQQLAVIFADQWSLEAKRQLRWVILTEEKGD